MTNGRAHYLVGISKQSNAQLAPPTFLPPHNKHKPAKSIHQIVNKKQTNFLATVAKTILRTLYDHARSNLHSSS
ncbi:hypothetical protein Syun_018698 [Stephania yunnanensis]|uniref:Uncharacterized protein n=1 Tax=Stephania yunnanensis TaxID=152371 RepID=A0AAP0IV31_9MAGN